MKHVSTSKSAFTLAEILLAILVFAIASSTILALLARSIETAEEILVKDEAMNLTSALESYMDELPFFDSGSALNAYTLIQDTSRVGLWAFQYAGDLNDLRTDGTLFPMDDLDGEVLGEDYTIIPTIRDPGLEAAELAAEADAKSGRVFFVRLQESPANPWRQDNGMDPLPDNPNEDDGMGRPRYNSAVLVIQADFFAMPRVITAAGQLNTLLSNSTPAFTYNFAVRR